MASRQWLSHTHLPELGASQDPSPVFTDPTLPSLVSGTQWPRSPSSRQPVCRALTPDAEINASHDSIVSHFPKLSSAILEGGIGQAFGQFRGLEGL